MEERICRVCGCTEDNACEGGCSWVEEDLCSACVDEDENDVESELMPEAPNEIESAEDEKQVKLQKVEKFTTAEEKLKSEYEKFKSSAKSSTKEAMVSRPVLEALLNFCEDESFSAAVLANPNTLQDCLSAIMKGAGSVISDLEVYQRAAAFYFPNAKISFHMTIDTNGLEMPVAKKEIIAKMENTEKLQQSIAGKASDIAKVESKKITINLDALL